MLVQELAVRGGVAGVVHDAAGRLFVYQYYSPTGYGLTGLLNSYRIAEIRLGRSRVSWSKPSYRTSAIEGNVISHAGGTLYRANADPLEKSIGYLALTHRSRCEKFMDLGVLSNEKGQVMWAVTLSPGLVQTWPAQVRRGPRGGLYTYPVMRFDADTFEIRQDIGEHRHAIARGGADRVTYVYWLSDPDGYHNLTICNSVFKWGGLTLPVPDDPSERGYYVHDLDVSPDGKTLVLAVSSGGQQSGHGLMFFDIVDNGGVTDVRYNRSFDAQGTRVSFSPDGTTLAVLEPHTLKPSVLTLIDME